MVQIRCLLGAIPPLKACPCGQGVGGELTAGCGGWVKPDRPGQAHVPLGGLGLAEPTQGPVEIIGEQGLTAEKQRCWVLCPPRAAYPPASVLGECPLCGCLLSTQAQWLRAVEVP